MDYHTMEIYTYNYPWYVAVTKVPPLTLRKFYFPYQEFYL